MKKPVLLLFLIIPVILLFTAHLIKHSQGFYYQGYYDPTYVYLISSLNFSQFVSTSHTDHPGIPVQVLGAIVIKVLHWVSGNEREFVPDVLFNPEKYISAINLTLVVINSFALFAIGFFTFRLTGNLWLSFLLQLAPFVSNDILSGLVTVTPENFLICVVVFLTGVFIFYQYKIPSGGKTPFIMIIIFSIICGLGLVTKIIFAPLIIIPLILIRGWKSKILFVLFSMAAFSIFLLPSISRFFVMAIWVKKLFIYDGHYGGGEPNIVDTSEYFKNIASIFTNDYFFSAVYALSLIVLILAWRNRMIKNEKTNNSLRILFAIFLAMTLQIAMVSKQYKQHYMNSVTLLGVYQLALCILVLPAIAKFRFSKFITKYGYASSALIVFSIAVVNVAVLAEYRHNGRLEAVAIEELIGKTYPDELLIVTYESSNPECAISFGVNYSGELNNHYRTILLKDYSGNLFYNPWGNTLVSFDKDINLKKKLSSKKIILQLNQFGTIENFMKAYSTITGYKNANFKKVYSNIYGDSVYEITGE